MLVKELIIKLKEVDQDLLVLQRGYESGMDDIGFRISKVIKRKDYQNREGEYEFEDEGVDAVILGSAG